MVELLVSKFAKLIIKLAAYGYNYLIIKQLKIFWRKLNLLFLFYLYHSFVSKTIKPNIFGNSSQLDINIIKKFTNKVIQYCLIKIVYYAFIYSAYLQTANF